MLAQFLNEQLVSIFLVVGFFLRLKLRSRITDRRMRHFYMAVFCCALLILSELLEEYAAQDPSRRFWRILFSALGYSLRPASALSMLLVAIGERAGKRVWLFWVPAVVNTLLAFSAFFSRIYFWFDEESYAFARGPLNYLGFFVAGLYLLLLFFVTYQRYRVGKTTEVRVLMLCGISCVLAAVFDIEVGGKHLTAFILIGVIFYYMFINQQDADLDALTGLRNRQAFYADLEDLERNITAVASVDMNGLKRLNDSKGHDAGDEALRTIGRCMAARAGNTVIPYRIGGDEFMILFLKKTEADVSSALEVMTREIAEASGSVAAGYAMREGHDDLNAVIRESDQRMYENKSAYYRQSGHDRRRR